MALFVWMNSRINRFSIIDIKLVQGAAMCFAVIIVKLIPQILTIDMAWFVVLAILLAARPMYIMYFKK